MNCIDLVRRQNFLRINDENASADMPYFGRAFSAGYSSSGGGIKFEGTMDELDIQKNDKKHRVIVKFTIKGIDDTYVNTLTIYGLESATLNVSSNKRQGITYTGVINAFKEEK